MSKSERVPLALALPLAPLTPGSFFNMSTFKYSKYTGEGWDELSLEQLLEALADFLLHSGFHRPYYDYLPQGDNTLQELHDAILEALLHGGIIPEEWRRQLQPEGSSEISAELERLVQQLMERLVEEGYINARLEALRRRPEQRGPGGYGTELGRVRFELTDKSIDFLGYKTLKDLLASLGKSSFGRHETRELSTGVEAAEAPKPYEFGDTLNLNISETLLNSIKRAGFVFPLQLDYSDLMVHQSEYQSSCATVLMLDCSHSMILYGEDRFTPAKKVALALAHLIRTQYPGDSLHVVLFHDSAEEIPLANLARVQVGPFYTNTREGLQLAQRILQRQRKDMRQIIMITDGKPSAITQPGGRIYKNAFGLDPLIVNETFKEVAACRKRGILVNTFMLARDYDLVAFVKKVAEICRGKAYFTTPYTLGQYVLVDFMARKTRKIH